MSSRHQKAELTAKRQQEEDAAKKKLAEEAAAKKQEEEAAGSAVLDGLTIGVQNSREAMIRLICSDIAPCGGKLTLTARSTASRGKTRRARTESIGTATFSIAADEKTMVEFALDKAGRALLSAAHGHLSATLTIVRTAPLPYKTQTQRVRLGGAEGSKAKGHPVARQRGPTNSVNDEAARPRPRYPRAQ